MAERAWKCPHCGRRNRWHEINCGGCGKRRRECTLRNSSETTMKRAAWKEEDRTLSVRAEIAQHGQVAWHSPSRGTFNEGRNAAKRARRATQYGSTWVNPRAMSARPTKPVRPFENHRRRAANIKRALGG